MRSGEKYSMLTAMRPVEENARRARWIFRCDCGNEKAIRVDHVKTGNNKSCGCLHEKGHLKHGLEGTSVYCAWSAMKSRCTNQNHKSYSEYGGRGIKVCSRWFSFENFLADMGVPEEGLTLDRIDNNGDYTPQNCRWTTMTVQMNNRRNTRNVRAFGEIKSIAQWSKDARCSISRHALGARINSGWNPEIAIVAPLRVKEEFAHV